MSDYPQLKLKNQLCFPLYAAARQVTSAYTPYLRPLGLTYTQYLVMMVLWECDGLRVSDICGLLRLDSGTITPLIKKLCAEGLAEKRHCEDDERSVRVFLTEKGRALEERASGIPGEIAGCVRLEPGEAGELYRLLYKLLGEN